MPPHNTARRFALLTFSLQRAAAPTSRLDFLQIANKDTEERLTIILQSPHNTARRFTPLTFALQRAAVPTSRLDFLRIAGMTTADVVCSSHSGHRTAPGTLHTTTIAA